MYSSRSVLTRRLKQKQRVLEEYAIKKYSERKTNRKRKTSSFKKSKGYVPENGEGRSSEKVRITAKIASAQNTGLNWITMLAHP
jgi:hypothetical protein